MKQPSKQRPIPRDGGSTSKTSPITKALLAILLIALLGVSAYYVVAVYIPAQQQANAINSTIEEQR